MADFSTTGIFYLFDFSKTPENLLFNLDSSPWTDNSFAYHYYFDYFSSQPFNIQTQNGDQTHIIRSSPDQTEQPKYYTIQVTINNPDFTGSQKAFYSLVSSGYNFTIWLQNPYVETDLTGGSGSYSIIGGDHIIKVSKIKE